jgi:hypothetical protein
MQINRRQRGQKKGLIWVPAHKLYFPRIQADHQGSFLSTQGKSTSKAEARALGRRTIFFKKKYIYSFTKHKTGRLLGDGAIQMMMITNIIQNFSFPLRYRFSNDATLPFPKRLQYVPCVWYVRGE